MEATDYEPQTHLFVGARGVFQGGGCRAAAHVGAYQAALKCGVRFSEVAGTSAGSIIAALIGAGASAEFVKQELLDLDFQRFLKPPKLLEESLPWHVRALCVPFSRVLGQSVSSYALRAALNGGGAYSSAELQRWLNDLLKRLLPGVDRTVRFKDLLIPTSVVSTDLGSGVAKIWSVDETPDEEVALAVRASCSIPVFFQPVPIGETRHVDGGLLSNLPAFIFERDSTPNSLGGRVLAFSLVDEFNPPESWRPLELGRRLLNTVVDGATELQTRIQPGTHVVKIPTQGVTATDFGKMDPAVTGRLYKSGWDATLDFLRNEIVNARNITAESAGVADEDEFYAAVVREAIHPGDTLIVADNDTHWFWVLFPTALSWKVSGARLKVIVHRDRGTEEARRKEDQRRLLLKKFGAELHEVAQLPWRGVIVKRSDANRDAAFIKNESKSAHAPYATLYVGALHRTVIRLLSDGLPASSTELLPTVTLTETSDEELIERLRRGVSQYAKPGVEMRLERLAVSDVLTINSRVRVHKYQQIEGLVRAYERHSLPLFGPAKLTNSQGEEVSVITPPVIERHGDHLVALEGNTRLLYAFHSGITEIEALCVSGVRDPLPGTPVDLRRVLLTSRHLPSEQRIKGFNYDNFRNIERAARPLE